MNGRLSKNGHKEMRNEELYFANEKLVHYVLKKHFTDRQFDEDLQQIGRLGLWKACLTYDKDISKFSTYACQCIRNAVSAEVRSALRQKRKNKNDILVSLNEPAFKSDDLERLMLSDIIPGDNDVIFIDFKGFWDSLTPIEKDVVRCLANDKKVPEIAKELGISHTTIWRCKISIREKWDTYI